MSVLQRGDRLVVSELSRLGRSLGQIVAILDALAKAGVAFVALKENIRVEGKRDLQTKVMTTLFALFAEVERDLISERTREGLARARSSGRKLGRPKGSLGVSRLDGKEGEIRRFLELGVSKTAIAKITGVSRTTLYSFMSTRGLKPSPFLGLSRFDQLDGDPHHVVPALPAVLALVDRLDAVRPREGVGPARVGPGRGRMAGGGDARPLGVVEAPRLAVRAGDGAGRGQAHAVAHRAGGGVAFAAGLHHRPHEGVCHLVSGLPRSCETVVG